MKRLIIGIVAIASALAPFGLATAQPPLAIKPLAEKKVADLPAGALYWRVESTLGEARAAEGPWTLVAESGGKVWAFTLGPSGGPRRTRPR